MKPRSATSMVMRLRGGIQSTSRSGARQSNLRQSGLWGPPCGGCCHDPCPSSDRTALAEQVRDGQPAPGAYRTVLDFAKTRGRRSGENPAAWKGHLALTLPRFKVRKVKRHAAIPWREIGDFMLVLQDQQSVGCTGAAVCHYDCGAEPRSSRRALERNCYDGGHMDRAGSANERQP